MADLRNPEGRAIGPSLETIQSADVGIYAAEGDAWEIDEDDFGLEPYGNGYVVTPLPALEQITPQQVSDYFGDPLALVYTIDIDTADPSSDSITYPELEVRDHATQQVLASTHIQLFAMDAYDYNDCVRRMSGVFLLQGCIDVESIDADLRLQLCDIEDPPAMMLTVMQDEEWSNLIIIKQYFDESALTGSSTNLFQDPVKSWWIDMEATPTGLNPHQAGIVDSWGDGPAPHKDLVVTPCYDGTIMLRVTHREPADESWEHASKNALDDGLPMRGGGFFDWQQHLLHPGLIESDPDSWIDIPAVMVNLSEGSENPNPDLSAEFGTNPDLATDDSHLEYGSQHPNVKAIHGGWSIGTHTNPDVTGEPNSELSEPFTKSTIHYGDRRKYPVKGGDDYLFQWDGRQMKFVDKLKVEPGEMSPLFYRDDCVGQQGRPLYFPPGEYGLSLDYVAGSMLKSCLTEDEHNISFAYASALCINAWTIENGVGTYDVAKYFNQKFETNSICSTYYACNFQDTAWDWTCPINSGLVASMLSYNPILIYHGHGAEGTVALGWGDLLGLNQRYQCGYKKDFVFFAMCNSWDYCGYLVPSPLIFWGYDGPSHAVAAHKFVQLFCDARAGDGFRENRTIQDAYLDTLDLFDETRCPLQGKENREAWRSPSIAVDNNHGGGDLCFVAGTGNEDNGVIKCFNN